MQFPFYLRIGLRIAGLTTALMLLSIGFVHAQSSMKDAFGLRIGIAERGGEPSVKPVLNPFYEVPFGAVNLSAELFLAFQNFQTLDFPTFNQFYFDSYGFQAKVRYSPGGAASLDPFAALGIGFDAYSDKVSFGVPLSGGIPFALSGSAQLEFAGFVEPLFYFGASPGFRYGATIGVRFVNIVD